MKKTEIAKNTESPKATASPDVYNEIIKRIVPVSVGLVEVYSQLARRTTELLKTESAWSEAEKVEGPLVGTYPHEYVIRQTGQFSCVPLIGAGKPVIGGQATYEVIIGSELEIPDEFWNIFLRRNVVLYTHPAFRELASSIIARANLMALPMGSVSVTQRVVSLEAKAVAPAKKSAPKNSLSGPK